MKKILFLVLLVLMTTACGGNQTPDVVSQNGNFDEQQASPTPEPPIDTPEPPTDTPEPTAIPSDTLPPTMTPTLPPLGEEGNPIVWAIVMGPNLDVFIPALDQARLIMEDRTGLFVETYVVDNYLQIVDMLCSSQAHFGALNAFSYLLAEEKGCASISMTAELFGSSAYLGQLLVRSDSNIESITDLAGTTFCRRSEDSKSTWVVPRLMMLAAGLDPDNDFIEVIDTGDIPNVISGIYNGTCDAGATYVDARADHQGTYPDILNKIHILVHTPLIPNDSVILSPALSTEMREQLEAVFYFFEIFEGGQVLKDVYGWDGLIESEDYLFDPLREVIDQSGVDLETLVQD